MKRQISFMPRFLDNTEPPERRDLAATLRELGWTIVFDGVLASSSMEDCLTIEAESGSLDWETLNDILWRAGRGRCKDLGDASQYFTGFVNGLRHGPSGVYDAHWAERMQRFRESIPGLPEVIPFQRTPGKYTRLTMNVGEKIEGLRFDGFRFKAPASNGDFDLDWEFVCPCETEYPYRVVRSWNVTGSNRTLSAEDHLVMHLSGPPTDTDFYTGFQFYRDWWDYHEEGASLPKENCRVVASLHGGHVSAGKECAIWLTFDGTKNTPVEIYHRVILTPS